MSIKVTAGLRRLGGFKHALRLWTPVSEAIGGRFVTGLLPHRAPAAGSKIEHFAHDCPGARLRVRRYRKSRYDVPLCRYHDTDTMKFNPSATRFVPQMARHRLLKLGAKPSLCSGFIDHNNDEL